MPTKAQWGDVSWETVQWEVCGPLGTEHRPSLGSCQGRQLERVGGHHGWATSSGSQQGQGSGAVVQGSTRGRRSEEMVGEELWW